MSTAELVEKTSTKLEMEVAEYNLEPATAQNLLTSYRPFFEKAHELVNQAEAVKVLDATQVTEINESRRIRLELVKVRTGADKLRKSMKEDSLRKGKAIDGAFNILRYMVEPIEEALLSQEQFAERAEAERKERLKSERMEKLIPFGWTPSPGFNLAEMKQDDFEYLLDTTKSRFEQAQEAARKAEEERIAKEKAEREEQERIKKENEALRLENERIEREKQEAYEKAQREREELEAKARADRERAELEARKAKAEADRILKEAEEKAAADKKAAEEKAQKEREAAERARLEAEVKARIEREAIEAKARAEREAAEAEKARLQKEAEEKERVERNAREKAEHELQIIRQAEAKAKAEKEEAEQKAANAPDCDKLMAFKEAIANAMPVLSKPSRTEQLTKQVNTLFAWIDSRIEGMR